METLSLSEYNGLIEQATPLACELVDGQIVHKVLQLPDRSILKLFRLKRLLTSARLYPHTKRFQKNIERLNSLGIATVSLKAVYRIPAIKRTAVHYRFFSGLTLREHCQTAMDAQLAERFGHFFASLHQKGIYFRSIHFGNMVIAPDGRIGLIDVVDMRFRRRPLNMGLRIRNLRHLFRYNADIDCLAPVRHVFIEAYCHTTQLNLRRENRLRRHFEAYFQGAP
jgi:tRNA A-37 threonylcarbamoyl transferase component Bud32